MKFTNQQLLVLGLVVVAVIWYLRRQAGEVLGKAGEAVNITSPNNLAYTGTNAVGQAISQDESWNLGVWLWEVFNPEQLEREQELLSDDY